MRHRAPGTASQVVSYARLTDRLDGSTAFSAGQVLLPNAASWLLMAASSVPLAWGLRKRVGIAPCQLVAPGRVMPSMSAAYIIRLRNPQQVCWCCMQRRSICVWIATFMSVLRTAM